MLPDDCCPVPIDAISHVNNYCTETEKSEQRKATFLQQSGTDLRPRLACKANAIASAQLQYCILASFS